MNGGVCERVCGHLAVGSSASRISYGGVWCFVCVTWNVLRCIERLLLAGKVGKL